MNIEKYTQNAQQAVMDCQNIAISEGHQMLDGEHLHMALLMQKDGPLSLERGPKFVETGREEAQPLLGALLPHEEIDETGLLFERLAAAHDGTDDENLLDRAELLARLHHLPEMEKASLRNIL